MRAAAPPTTVHSHRDARPLWRLLPRPGARTIVGAVLLVLMTAFLQSLLAGLADDHVIFGALHASDGLLILAIPTYLYVWTGRRAA